MRISKRTADKFHSFILDWWDNHKRDLPWRHTHDPYRILVSEIMLQQTQVSRVLPKYAAFLSRFPTVDALARASASDVLKAWKGMGYNRRALYLQKAAREVVETFGGRFPDNEASLLKLPGVGLYTARAILVFAYKMDVAMVDTNIRQIIIKYFFHGKDQSPSVVQSVADQLVPSGKSWEWHQALMDFGALSLERPPKDKNRAKPAVAFKDSARFVRGRIIDTLREHAIPKQELIRVVSETCSKPETYVSEQLDTLASEGLLQMSSDGTVSLPD